MADENTYLLQLERGNALASRTSEVAVATQEKLQLQGSQLNSAQEKVTIFQEE